MAAVNPALSTKRLVIKIGSALLVDAETGRLRTEWLQGLAADVADLKASGVDVLLVSSGSIALGRRVLGYPDDITLSLEHSQAAAAVGQIKLARAYEQALVPHKITAAQILLTLEDSGNRRRYLNSRATLNALLDQSVVPIVNENDTVATDEIRYGDNDRLAAQVASMAGADVLVLLSDVDGLYTGNPKLDPTATRLDVIHEITPDIEQMAGDPSSAVGTGGMKTKLLAAKIATQAGCAMAIMEGDVDRPIQSLRNGVGCSWFVADADPKAARKQWIASMKPKGTVIIDAGAQNALINGKSLLPAGVSQITGDFDRGDAVLISGPDGREIARGLASYGAVEGKSIIGLKTAEIQDVLGYPARAALIHRDDLVM